MTKEIEKESESADRLHAAVRAGDADEVRRLLAEGGDPDARGLSDENGEHIPTEEKEIFYSASIGRFSERRRASDPCRSSPRRRTSSPACVCCWRPVPRRKRGGGTGETPGTFSDDMPESLDPSWRG